MPRQGVVNKLSDVTFLQGDLAEAWREPQGALCDGRHALFPDRHDGGPGLGKDRLRRSHRAGTSHRGLDLRPPSRRRPGDWKLSAIQQV